MSTKEQAEAYLREAELTLSSAQAIYNSASEQREEFWAQVVKNGYDAIEQAVSAAIAAEDESIPRAHPAKINRFIELHQLGDELENQLLHWLAAFTFCYNYQRPNQVLDNRMPAEKVTND